MNKLVFRKIQISSDNKKRKIAVLGPFLGAGGSYLGGKISQTIFHHFRTSKAQNCPKKLGVTKYRICSRFVKILGETMKQFAQAAVRTGGWGTYFGVRSSHGWSRHCLGSISSLKRSLDLTIDLARSLTSGIRW